MDIVSAAFDPAQQLIAEVCTIQQAFLAKCSIVQKEITINYPTAEQLDQMHAVVTDEAIA